MTRRQTGLLLAAIQVGLVGSLGLKLLVDRARLPRAWALTQPFDPSTPLRGRYVRLSLVVPLAGGQAQGSEYDGRGVRLRAAGDRLVGEIDTSAASTRVRPDREGATSRSVLVEPVAFFIPEHVPDPSLRPPGEELWVEVTIPSGGPPRPIRLGIMKDGRLSPLELR